MIGRLKIVNCSHSQEFGITKFALNRIYCTQSYDKVVLSIGAFNITREAQLRSQEAQQMVDGTNKYLQDSSNVRAQVENMLQNSMANFNDSLIRNQEALRELDAEVKDLSDKIQDINTKVRFTRFFGYMI